MIRFAKRAAAIIALALAATPAVASADTGGALDLSFGTNGRVLTTLNTSAGAPTSAGWIKLLPQPDGRILAVGNATFGTGPGANTRVVVARFMPDGAFDTSFAGGGRALFGTPGSPTTDAVDAVQVPSGDLVIGANSRFDQSLATDDRGVLIKVAPNGQLVDAFATHGVRVIPDADTIHPKRSHLTGVTFSEGQLLTARVEDLDSLNVDTVIVAPHALNDGNIYNQPASTPNGAWQFNAPPSDHPVWGRLASFQSGAMLAYGDGANLGAEHFTSDGNLDRTAGRQVGFSGASQASPGAIAISLRQDRVLVAGAIVVGGESETAIARFKADGGTDNAFGQGGKVVLNLPGNERPTDLAYLPDGRMLVAIETLSNDRSTAIARLLPDGRLDPSFGGDGIVLDRPFGSNVSDSAAVAADGDDVIAGGYEVNAQRQLHFELERFTKPSLHLASCTAVAGCLTLAPLAQSLVIAAEPSACTTVKPPCSISLSVDVTRVEGSRRTPVGTVNLGKLARVGGLRWDLRVKGKLLTPGRYELRVAARKAAGQIIRSTALSIQIKRDGVGITPIPIP